MAEELRLSCNMLIQRTYFSGNSESQKEMVFADIDFDSSYLSAQLKGPELIFSVGSKSIKNKYSTTEVLSNTSNDNKWEITNLTTISGNIEIENYIDLDRNSGKINIRSVFMRNAHTTTTIGSGMCEKINTKSKKF